jgi:hypothetical protein
MPHATLSDLLADDVKDYFRREGVSGDNLAIDNNTHNQRRRRRPAAGLHNENFSAAVPVLSATTSDRSTPMQQTEQVHLQNNQQRHRRLSSGSDSQRNAHLSAQDAEFLKRYAEEKERASRKIRTADASRNISAPRDLVTKDLIDGIPRGGRSSNVNTKNDRKIDDLRPYQTLAASPRPPSVTGSHRPQLPSIDNDDWEEDDRLERKEWRKMERRRKRSGSADGHLRKPSSASGSHGRKMSNASGVSYGNGSYGYGHWSSNNSVGSGSFVRHYQQPVPYPGVQHSPGVETLCYSTSSQSILPHYETKLMHSFLRKESDDTFVRKESTDWHSSSPRENGEARGHVRPLSYLSASSESEQKSEVNNSSSLGPSPLSSGTYKSMPHDRHSLRSKDGSDVSALWGGSILESSSPGSDKPQPYRQDYRYNRIESSEESSDDESYTSSSAEESDSDYKNHVTTEKNILLPPHKSYGTIPRKPSRRPKVSPLRLDDACKVIWDKLWSAFVVLELYISNMPSLVGSLALAWGTLGVDWFKVSSEIIFIAQDLLY